MEIVGWVLFALSIGVIVQIARIARRRPPGSRLVLLFEGLFFLGLTLWTVATLWPYIPLLSWFSDDSLLYQVREPGGILALASLFAMVGLLVGRAIDHLGRQRSNT